MWNSLYIFARFLPVPNNIILYVYKCESLSKQSLSINFSIDFLMKKWSKYIHGIIFFFLSIMISEKVTLSNYNLFSHCKWMREEEDFKDRLLRTSLRFIKIVAAIYVDKRCPSIWQNPRGFISFRGMWSNYSSGVISYLSRHRHPSRMTKVSHAVRPTTNEDGLHLQATGLRVASSISRDLDQRSPVADEEEKMVVLDKRLLYSLSTSYLPLPRNTRREKSRQRRRSEWERGFEIITTFP